MCKCKYKNPVKMHLWEMNIYDKWLTPSIQWFLISPGGLLHLKYCHWWLPLSKWRSNHRISCLQSTVQKCFTVFTEARKYRRNSWKCLSIVYLNSHITSLYCFPVKGCETLNICWMCAVCHKVKTLQLKLVLNHTT